MNIMIGILVGLLVGASFGMAMMYCILSENYEDKIELEQARCEREIERIKKQAEDDMKANFDMYHGMEYHPENLTRISGREFKYGNF